MILLYIFAGVVFINCCYYILFSRFSFLKPAKNTSKDSFPVSLIVCAKNESENLKNHIPFWLQQNHTNFEIILINDASIDNTLEVMEDFAKNNSKIKIVNVENNETFWGNKKYALTLGIKKAIHQRMIFTDADCKPNSNNWLTEMASNFTEEKQLVLGFGAYQKLSGVLNKLIRYETFITAVQYFSYAKAGIPYMGVGRNLGYTSKLYYDNKGFISHINIKSGDDDLFVNEVATATNTAICFNKDSFTYSIPKKTWKQWFNQKRRHITTAKYYKSHHKFLLGLFFISQILFWILTGIIFLFVGWEIPAAIIAFRFLIQGVILSKAAGKLEQKDLLYLFPLWELLLSIIQLFLFIFNSSSKSTTWK